MLREGRYSKGTDGPGTIWKPSEGRFPPDKCIDWETQMIGRGRVSFRHLGACMLWNTQAPPQVLWVLISQGRLGKLCFSIPGQFLAPEPTKNDEDQEGEAGPHRRMYCSRHGVMEGFQEHLLDALVHSHPPS